MRVKVPKGTERERLYEYVPEGHRFVRLEFEPSGDIELIYEPIPDVPIKRILVCGYCQAPKDISESVTQASAVASKAAEVSGMRRRLVENG